MNERHLHDMGDELDHLIDALRDAPDGPGPEAAASTLAAVRRAVSQGAIPKDPAVSLGLLKRMMTMTYEHRKAAAAVTCGAVGVVVLAMLTSLASISYAQVSKQIRNFNSLACTTTTTVSGQKEPITIRMMYLGGKTRNEIAGRITIIRDPDARQMLALNATFRTAHLIKYDVVGDRPPAQIGLIDIIGQMRKLAEKEADPIGQEQIGNVKAKGFRVNDAGQQMRIWVDPSSGAPLRIEMEYQVAGVAAKTVITEIAFDAPLDEALFSMKAPAGYQSTPDLVMKVNLNLQEAVVGMLRRYAKKTGGRFPASLDDASVTASPAPKAGSPGELDPEDLQMMSDTGVVRGLTMLLEKGKDYDYRPGARLGDSGSIVFWHRDKDKGTYRAVYGDLSVKDLKPTDVPPPVKDTPAPPTPVRAVPPGPPTAASPEVAPPRVPAPAPARPPTRDTPELLPAQPQDR